MAFRLVSLFLLSCLVVGCKPKKPAPLQSMGAALCDLPIVADALPFQPEAGRFAEMVKEKEGWRGFIDGVDQGLLKGEEQYQDFAKRWRDQVELDSLIPRVLISADKDIDWQELALMIRSFAAAGVCYYHFNSRTPDKSGAPQAIVGPMLDLRMGGARGSALPLLIVVNKDGRLMKYQDSAMTLAPHEAIISEDFTVSDSDEPSASLSFLDEVLGNEAERLRPEDLRPAVQFMLFDGATYQRFVDVLNTANRHDAHASFVDPGSYDIKALERHPKELISKPPIAPDPDWLPNHQRDPIEKRADHPEVE